MLAGPCHGSLQDKSWWDMKHEVMMLVKATADKAAHEEL